MDKDSNDSTTSSSLSNFTQSNSLIWGLKYQSNFLTEEFPIPYSDDPKKDTVVSNNSIAKCKTVWDSENIAENLEIDNYKMKSQETDLFDFFPLLDYEPSKNDLKEFKVISLMESI